MAPDPNLVLRACTMTDIPALAAVKHASFTAPRTKIMYRDVTTEDKYKLLEESLRREFASPKDSAHPQSVNFLCVFDTTTADIISYATWIYLPNGYLASEDADTQHPWLPPGINAKLVRDFDRMTAELRSAHPGRKEAHWLLSMLATHPKHEGRGAGSMLIKWAFPKADDMGLRCYVDSSVVGYPVYRRRGFGEDVGVMDLDLGKYEGGEEYGVQRWVAMMREPEKVHDETG